MSDRYAINRPDVLRRRESMTTRGGLFDENLIRLVNGLRNIRKEEDYS